MCGVLVYSIIIIYGKFGTNFTRIIKPSRPTKLWMNPAFYTQDDWYENVSDQAEAKEARQNIVKHVQTELVSETHSSEVIFIEQFSL